jgi:hypothetical protein
VLPEAVAFAVLDFITGALLDNPRRRGTYRILYRVDDEKREVIVLRIGHRRDVYRSP